MQMPNMEQKPCVYCVKDEEKCTCGCMAWEKWFATEWKKVCEPLKEYFNAKREK